MFQSKVLFIYLPSHPLEDISFKNGRVMAVEAEMIKGTKENKGKHKQTQLKQQRKFQAPTFQKAPKQMWGV